jgi:hypothetical protein
MNKTLAATDAKVGRGNSEARMVTPQSDIRPNKIIHPSIRDSPFIASFLQSVELLAG